ncbi:MAG TPA: DUF6084 family protein [Tepidisphaeraceae bacterium]|nr:DUF6084 family protein [Tepidisphaeraceae bacterium]
MPELNFHIESANAIAFAASPQISLKVRIAQQDPVARIHSVLLRVQVRIEPGRRRYSSNEQEKLFELFGEPHRWGQTMRSMLWTHVTAVVPAFTDNVTVDLALPCTYDFSIATAKYFNALEDGQIPLSLLFSGTIFYAGDDDELQICQIPWEKETSFNLDVSIWKKVMEIYYPNSAPVSLRRDVFDQLYQFKSRRGLATWEQAIELLLASAEESAAL